jgi:hypothetical protein
VAPLLVGEGIAILGLTPHGRRLEETYLARYAAGRQNWDDCHPAIQRRSITAAVMPSPQDLGVEDPSRDPVSLPLGTYLFVLSVQVEGLGDRILETRSMRCRSCSSPRGT